MNSNPEITIQTPDKPAIIFDLGGVLVDWNPRHLYRRMFAEEALMEKFLAEVCTQAWNEEQDAGRAYEDAIGILLIDYPEHEELIRAWINRWEEMLEGAIDGTVAILRQLKSQNYDLYALSNWSAETWHHGENKFEFLKWFREIIISGHYKVKKPDSRIFEIALGKIGKPAEECVFIDDSLPNVLAARQLGFRAIHFQSPEQLRADLLRFEIEVV